MNSKLSSVESFGLKVTELARMRQRRARATIYLNTYGLTGSVTRLLPEQRHRYLALRADRRIAGLRRRFPELSFSATQPTPSSLQVEAPLSSIVRLASDSFVSSIYITSISGLRRRAQPANQLRWFCVRGRVAIKIENKESGMQTIEDRFVLVKAHSHDDAKRRLRRQWKEYASPYMNPQGRMVKWELEKVIDSYETFEVEANPNGFEVYSKLYKRRLPRESVWRRNRRKGA